MLKKIAPLSSSQKNETANSVIGTKSLKIRYYGGSKSNDYRVTAGVAQVNEGKTVGINLLINVNGDRKCGKIGGKFAYHFWRFMFLTKAPRYICDHYCLVLNIRRSKKYFATPTKTRLQKKKCHR